jgi:hypothetical protein
MEPSSFTTQQTFSKTPKARLFEGTGEYKLIVAGADGIGKSAKISQIIRAWAQLEQFEYGFSLYRSRSWYSVTQRGNYDRFLPVEG